MNERYKTLWSEAAESNGGDSWEEQTAFMSKFAELIVKECAEHALAFNNNIQSLNDKEIRSHSNRVSDYIKDRMGVEN